MEPLGMNLEQLKADFESVGGKPFEHFYCPILHVDEDVPPIKGHVVPESLGGRAMVLQRPDVDNGFGSFFEAEAGDAIRKGLDANPLDVVSRADPAEMRKLGKRFNLNLLLEGADEPVEARFGDLGGEYGFYVKHREDLHEALGGEPGDRPARGLAEVELDARSSILVTSLRASHLAWFRTGWRMWPAPGSGGAGRGNHSGQLPTLAVGPLHHIPIM